MCYQLIVCFIALMHLSVEQVWSEGCSRDYCEPPTPNKFVKYFPEKETYASGDVISLWCNQFPSYLFGSQIMTCGNSGNWYGEIPVCVLLKETSSLKTSFQDRRYSNPAISGPPGVNNYGNPAMQGQRGVGLPMKISINECLSGDAFIKLEVQKAGYTSESLVLHNVGEIKINGQSCTPSDFQRLHSSQSWERRDYLFECKLREERKREREEACDTDIELMVFPPGPIKLGNIYVFERPELECQLDFQICNGGLTRTGKVATIKHGQNVSVYCENAYQLKGSDQIQCRYGSFIYDREPQCNPVRCDSSPPKVLNGRWDTWNGSEKYYYGSRLMATCDDGYVLGKGNNYTECQKDGVWSDFDVACIDSLFGKLTKYILWIVLPVLLFVVVLITAVFTMIKVKRVREGRATCDSKSDQTSEMTSTTERHVPIGNYSEIYDDVEANNNLSEAGMIYSIPEEPTYTNGTYSSSTTMRLAEDNLGYLVPIKGRKTSSSSEMEERRIPPKEMSTHLYCTIGEEAGPGHRGIPK